MKSIDEIKPICQNLIDHNLGTTNVSNIFTILRFIKLVYFSLACCNF